EVHAHDAELAFQLPLPGFIFVQGAGPAVGFDPLLDDGLGLFVGRGDTGRDQCNGQPENPTTHGTTSGKWCRPGGEVNPDGHRTGNRVSLYSTAGSEDFGRPLGREDSLQSDAKVLARP